MKRKGLAFTLIALGLAISARPIKGQTMPFLRQFPATPGINQATGVAVDESGIYVMGKREFVPAGFGVRKHDFQGNELWTREFSVFGTMGTQHLRAVAGATGVYVLGHTRAGSGAITGQFLRKYSSGGDELWTRQLEFFPTGLAADDSGVYVAGVLVHPDSGNFLRKYDAEGAELWTSRLPDPALSPYFGPVVVDSTGVYAFGPSSVGKWNALGNQLWTRRLDLPADYRLVAAAPEGFFVATGCYYSRGCQSLLRKYDADGNELWTRLLATSSPGVYPGGLAADATGVYLAGTTDLAGPALPGQCRSGSRVDSFVRRYDPDGVELWTREFGTSNAAWASDVAVDTSGVYVVGRVETWSPRDTAPPAGGAFLAKFEKTAAAVTGSRPRIFPDCVVNAASYVGGGVAPGEIVTLFGSGIGPAELVRPRLTEDRRLPTTLADTRLLFSGVPAPLLYVSDRQISATVPYAVADRTSVEVQVEYRGVRSDPVTVPVLASRPGIFSLDGSGRGQALILNEDGSLNSPSNPAPRGSVISIFATGGGESAPGVVDGQVVGGTLPTTSLPVSVVFLFSTYEDDWGREGEVLYAGGSAGSVAGLLQVNVRVPSDGVPPVLPGDAVQFALVIGSNWTAFQVTLALR